MIGDCFTDNTFYRGSRVSGKHKIKNIRNPLDCQKNAKGTQSATTSLGIQELVQANGTKRIKTHVFCNRTMETL